MLCILRNYVYRSFTKSVRFENDSVKLSGKIPFCGHVATNLQIILRQNPALYSVACTKPGFVFFVVLGLLQVFQ